MKYSGNFVLKPSITTFVILEFERCSAKKETKNGNGGVSNSALNNNPSRRKSGAGAKLPSPPKGFSRIWIDVSSTARKDKAGEARPSDSEIEKAVFARFGLSAETEADMSRLKERLGTNDNPFEFVRTTGDFTVPFRADGKYKIRSMSKNRSTRNLRGKAAEVKQQIETEKRAQNQSSNPFVGLDGNSQILFLTI